MLTQLRFLLILPFTTFRRQAELRLTVRVKDINDNRPQFERLDCRGEVPRDVPPASDILTLSGSACSAVKAK